MKEAILAVRTKKPKRKTQEKRKNKKNESLTRKISINRTDVHPLSTHSPLNIPFEKELALQETEAEKNRKKRRRRRGEAFVVAFVSRVHENYGGWETESRFERNGRLNNWRGREGGFREKRRPGAI